MPECPESIEELEALEQLLPLCKRTLYEVAKAKVESGAAQSRIGAARQIADETGRPVESIRSAIYRHEKEERPTQSVAMQQACETESQSEPENVYRIPATCPLPHVAQNTGENEWYTPPEFIEAARAVMGGIDCDPASSEIANEAVKAARFFTAAQDGRDKEWGPRVWMNPPYAQPLIAEFSEGMASRFESGQVKEACVLVNNATETGWFQRMMSVAAAAAFIKSRVRFLDPEGNPGAPLQGQCVLYFGENREKFYNEFSRFGIVLYHATV